ncbi:unnamed protein product [Protopolystoma xenopodis]|uniref:VOC domain-containing protein n=1 Tax=Protopolystoma xenopodis TaxID=117903 RepID=A0A3S5B0I7_9PLAT|nr:unnamed protein product [Protopolystoma xenopodis]
MLRLQTDNINAAISDLKSKGVRTLADKPATGAHGYPVVFLHPKDANGVLTELEQPDESWKRNHSKKT